MKRCALLILAANVPDPIFGTSYPVSLLEKIAGCSNSLYMDGEALMLDLSIPEHVAEELRLCQSKPSAADENIKETTPLIQPEQRFLDI